MMMTSATVTQNAWLGDHPLEERLLLDADDVLDGDAADGGSACAARSGGCAVRLHGWLP